MGWAENILGIQTGEKQMGMKVNGDLEKTRRKTAQRAKFKKQQCAKKRARERTQLMARGF